MNKYEFINQLDNALLGNVSEQERRDSIRYYTDYIDDEMRAGRTEKDVLESLGSPTAIARSIIEAKKDDRNREDIYQGYEEQEESRGYTKTKQVSGWKAWAWLAGIVIVFLFVISIVFKVVTAILPFVLIFLLVSFLFKFIFGK